MVGSVGEVKLGQAEGMEVRAANEWVDRAKVERVWVRMSEM